MKETKNLVRQLRNKSNIDYKYYHCFNNKLIPLKYASNNFTINYIIYIINSNFSLFKDFYDEIKQEFITDVFFERLVLSNSDKKTFFQMLFRGLFWLKLNNIRFLEEDNIGLINLIYNNRYDLNRLYLEECNLDYNFLKILSERKWFDILSFLNLDNNNIWDKGVNYLLDFLSLNNINLEYISLINNDISSNWIIKILTYFKRLKTLRILDLSSNNLLKKDEKELLRFIKDQKYIKELYLRNIVLSNTMLDTIINLFSNKKTNIYCFRFSLKKEQKNYKKRFEKLWSDLWILFDIDILWESQKKIYSTIYLKQFDKGFEGVEWLDNEYFYTLNKKSIENDFSFMLQEKDKYLLNGINLFLFDLHDYKKIAYLIENYNFNYIYLENYFISFKDFIYFINIIKKQFTKKYKINLISIEMSEEQLNFLIENFPENIFYIEVNLNKILFNRERYIMKMLKNKAFIFENMELYQKIFN